MVDNLLRKKTYQCWSDMKQRCLNKNSQAYKSYGGRGITVCKRWADSFENFLKDMGEKKDGMSLDRIDNDKGYSSENCRWATSKTQNRNHRGCTFIEYQGLRKTIIEWSEYLGISAKTIQKRYVKKLPLSQVFAKEYLEKTIPDKRNKTGYLGVYPSKNKWIALITVNSKSIYLGSYDTPELASEAYLYAKSNIKLRKLRDLNTKG